jgi:hypothetical protein
VHTLLPPAGGAALLAPPDRTNSIVGMWESPTQYRVIDPTTGKSEVVSIMVASDEARDPVFMDEVQQMARESVARGWKRPPRQPMTVSVRKELGATLNEIHKSHIRQAETGHSRYW